MKRLARVLEVLLAAADPEVGRVLAEMRKEERERKRLASDDVTCIVLMVCFMLLVFGIFAAYVWAIAHTGR